ncbi:MAG: FkbM family methyltransferase, partial [candidate division Zixibacteria bacterium]|nr:FkbM family methyltransferase [candidate division Zixibacteria bacterium]NIR64561.1 FkbM family methyltransferase [candidate division Zixibacteria bacterium]NIS44917.1 FkbM family methyltransferase [candidate division Zixibacteria bacterium]NIU14543.1 FkbM family methyltransferase [candidate division Zixibacteria bacterium]NIV05079.1 FkbM family methyltransferase [candidate division Zixibacteria bacterium]
MKNNQTYILPNGLSVHHLNKQETDFVYEEIFKEQIYFQHGISLKENATVFDIGANIGLFTLFIKQKYPSARVYAFEPSEEAFQCLQRNTSPYATTVMIYQCGISNDDKESVLTFYPSNSIMSGFYGNLEEEKSFLQDYIKEHLVQSRP